MYSNATSNHGGFVPQSGPGSSKHVTAIVTIRSGGSRTPPFLIVEGQYMMIDWFEPLKLEKVNRKLTFR